MRNAKLGSHRVVLRRDTVHLEKTDHLGFLVCRRSLGAPQPPQHGIRGRTEEGRNMR